MPDELVSHPRFILVVGAAIVLAMLLKLVLGRIGVPALIGFLAVGMLVRWGNDEFIQLPSESDWALDLLAEIGVICLLFRVGLKSSAKRLLGELKHAIGTWLSNILLAALLGFLATHYICGFGIATSLFVAAALSATSVGVTAWVWEEARALQTRTGALLLDVVELDDMSAVILMVIVFSVAPVVADAGSGGQVAEVALSATGWMLAKGVLFAAICFVLSRYAIQPTTWLFRSDRWAADRMVAVLGFGMIIAAIAGWLGFSVAVGALFAGLLFTWNIQARRLDQLFEPIYELFVPFFFIGIGYQLQLDELGASLAIGSILLVAAVLGKVGGAILPLYRELGPRGATLIGISLVPRAEIALFVARQGNQIGEWLVPSAVYGAVVFVSAATCFLTPFVMRGLLVKWRGLLQEHDRQTH